jgi:hypothetical protein
MKQNLLYRRNQNVKFCISTEIFWDFVPDNNSGCRTQKAKLEFCSETKPDHLLNSHVT